MQILPDIRNESAALKEMPKGYLEYLRRVEPYLRNQSEDCLYLNVWSVAGKNFLFDPLRPIINISFLVYSTTPPLTTMNNVMCQLMPLLNSLYMPEFCVFQKLFPFKIVSFSLSSFTHSYIYYEHKFITKSRSISISLHELKSNNNNNGNDDKDDDDDNAWWNEI